MIFQFIFPNHVMTFSYGTVASTNTKSVIMYGGSQVHLLRGISGNTPPPGGSSR